MHTELGDPRALIREAAGTGGLCTGGGGTVADRRDPCVVLVEDFVDHVKTDVGLAVDVKLGTSTNSPMVPVVVAAGNSCRKHARCERRQTFVCAEHRIGRGAIRDGHVGTVD
jgi:hypothetical protein